MNFQGFFAEGIIILWGGKISEFNPLHVFKKVGKKSGFAFAGRSGDFDEAVFRKQAEYLLFFF